MAWICETCGREFRNTNQWHSCEQSTIEQHLDNKPEFIIEIFHRLLDIILEFGEFELLPLKTVIQVQRSSTFLSIYLKKNKVHLQFQASEKKNMPYITKSIKISRNKYFHFADLRELSEINEDLGKTLNEAYNLSEPKV
ncbi:MAG: DUF5655 domain-containing protein [Bacteroidota bacterium]